MSETKRASNDFLKISTDEKRFLELMHVIPLSKEVQNDPASGLIPKEGLVVAELEKTLAPFLKKNGGVLRDGCSLLREGRSNVILTCPGRYHNDKSKRKSVTLAGSHRRRAGGSGVKERTSLQTHSQGDLLYGRGTTDCLGHVCLVTDFMCSVAKQCMENGTNLRRTDVVAVFIGAGRERIQCEQGCGY